MSAVKKDYVRPVDFKHGRVDMTHGGGGRAMAQLIDELFAANFANEWLAQGNDGAVIDAPARPAWSSPPTATSSRRCSSPAATSAACRCTAR